MDAKNGVDAPAVEVEVVSPLRSRRAEGRAWGGLRVEARTASPGRVLLTALPEHVLSLHVGPPARLTCHSRQRYVAGDTSLFPVGFSGTWVEEAPRRELRVRLAPALLRSVAEDLGLPPFRATLSLQHRFRDARVEHIVQALEADRASGLPNGRLYTEGLGLALASHLLRHFAAPGATQRPFSPLQARRVRDYIEAHLDQNLSLVRLARVVDLSTSHFRTLFKRTFGLPVHQYVIQRRVERARTLLQEGGLPLAQVALEAGFAHQSHLARHMRRLVGVAPSAFARAARSSRARRV